MPDPHKLFVLDGPRGATADRSCAAAAAKEPLTLVLFGATGDLSGRKILPALFALWQGKFLPEKIAIVGVAIEKLQRRSVSRSGAESRSKSMAA